MTNKAYLSRNVIFNEESFPAKDQATLHLPSKINAQGGAPVFFLVPIPISNVLSHAPLTTTATENPISPTHTPTSALERPSLTPTVSSSPTLDPVPIQPEPTSDPHPKPTQPPPTHHMITRSRTNSLRPKDFPNFQLYLTLTPDLESEMEPISNKKAAADPM